MSEKYTHAADSPIHKGLVLRKLGPGFVKVWIPTANSTVPQGQFKFIYQNTGSALDGNELENAIATSYNCRIATPLGSGAWMTADEGRGASVFGDPKKNQAYDYRIHQSVKAKNDRGTTRIFLSTNNPAQTYNPCNPSLGEVGGIPVESIGNMPPGNYPNIEPNQWVLVAFINSSFYPIVIASLPSEEEWEAVLKT